MHAVQSVLVQNTCLIFFQELDGAYLLSRLSFSIHLHFFFILSSASFYFLYVVRMRRDQNPNQPLAVIIPRVATLLYGIEYPFPAYSAVVVLV